MSGSASPSAVGKPHRRDKLPKLRDLFASSNSSTLNVPVRAKSNRSRSTSPSHATATQTGNSQNVKSQQTHPPDAGSSAPVPTPSLQVSSSEDISQAAWNKLPQSSRDVLKPFVASSTTNVIAEIDTSLAAVKQKRQECDARRWKFTLAGREFVLKETADHIVHWLNRFKSIGDIAASADPVHVGLPWAGVRFLLEIAVSEANQMASLLVGIETSVYMVNRLKVYMEILTRVPASQNRTNFVAALVELYVVILNFFARAVGAYKQSTFQRAISCVWSDSEVRDFEKETNDTANRLEIEASNCDRLLADNDRKVLQVLLDTLQQMADDRSTQNSVARIESMLDLQNLKVVKSAAWDAYDQHIHRACHPKTRIDLLQDLQAWARQPYGCFIFWLQGAAGTGKSTISQTMARWLSTQVAADGVGLGASFFFKRGEADRGSAALFFPTIAYQLATMVPGMAALLVAAVKDNPDICSKALPEQFRVLIKTPIQDLSSVVADRISVIVVDALDECTANDIDIVLQLWSTLPKSVASQLKLFLTSRPELPIKLKFRRLSSDIYQELILHELSETQVKHDMTTFLKDELGEIRNEFDHEEFGAEPLDATWPGDDTLQHLAIMAYPLFIIASILVLFIRDAAGAPREQLDMILNTEYKVGTMPQVAITYLPVLRQLEPPTRTREEIARFWAEFRIVIGTVIALAEPLSKNALSTLLGLRLSAVVSQLRPMSSVINNPRNPNTPLRCLRLSFGEFLMSSETKEEPSAINTAVAHELLLTKCLELMSCPSPSSLGENMCELSYPGKLRRDLPASTLEARFPPGLQYACKYWVFHAQSCTSKLVDHGIVHVFLKRHFLHWLEALSLLGCVTNTIDYLESLSSTLAVDQSHELDAFLNDAKRFILSFRYIIDLAPLQLYSSATIFAPSTSIIKTTCARVPGWISPLPSVAETWSSEVQRFFGHRTPIGALAVAPGGKQIASASWYESGIRIWDVKSGQEILMLETSIDRSYPIEPIVFSPDGSMMAADFVVSTLIWNCQTWQEEGCLNGRSSPEACPGVSAQFIAFSPDSQYLISTAENHTIRLWDMPTKQELRIFKGHSDWLCGIAFLSDKKQIISGSLDKTLRIWDVETGLEVKRIDVDDEITSFAECNGHEVVVASRSCLRLYNLQQGRMLAQFDVERNGEIAVVPKRAIIATLDIGGPLSMHSLPHGEYLFGIKGQIEIIRFSEDGQYLFAGRNGEIQQIDMNQLSGDPGSDMQKDRRYANSVYFSPDGRYLVSGNEEKLKLWDLSACTVIKEAEFDYNGLDPSDEMLALRLGLLRLQPRERFTNSSQNFLRSTTSLQISADAAFDVNEDCQADRLNVMDDWLRDGDQNLLWLPASCRPSENGEPAWGVVGDLCVIAHDDGGVSFIRVSLSSEQMAKPQK